jgi:multiple sugar transport system permease protein
MTKYDPLKSSNGQTVIRSHRMQKLSVVAVYVALLIWTAFTLLPLLWALAGSFMPLEDIFKNTTPFTWRGLIPERFTAVAYQHLFEGSFAKAVWNTLFISLVTVGLGLFVNSLAGFAFAVFDFPGKGALYFLVLITFMIPFEVIALPLYSIVTGLRFNDTYAALILPAVANGVIIILFRQFFAAIPKELLEAARVDGLPWWGIYARIVMPLSTPVILSAGVVLFISQWDSYYWPLLITTSEQYQVIQTALANFRTQYGTIWNEMFAGSVIATVIPTVILLFLQRHYISSVASTGTKE